MLQYPTQSLTTLPANHDIRHLVRQIMLLADEAKDRERTPLLMSQKIVQLLYKTTSPLGREVYVAILVQLCRNFENVANEAITWLLYAEDEVTLNLVFKYSYLLFSSPSAQVQRASDGYIAKQWACRCKPAGSTAC